jgi:hypothetical protein
LTDRSFISSVRRDPSRKKFFLKCSNPSQCKALKSPSYHVVCGCSGLRKGNGLHGIESRAKEMQGTMQLTAGGIAGFVVTVSVPFEEVTAV